MLNVLKIAWRNLYRYWRRTLLTAGLITIGIVAVLLFVALAGSFKNLMIGQITDSYLGHLQVHHRGYVASIESLPLNLNMSAAETSKVTGTLDGMPDVAAYSLRVKFGAMFSNFTETTNIRVNGVEPSRELATSPDIPNRIVSGRSDGFLAPGEIQIPELLARGMKVAVGDTVVLVATNRDGSVNGRPFLVRGILSGVTGPGGRDGYVHIDDARQLLRMTQPEVSEIAVRVDRLAVVDGTVERLRAALAGSGERSQYEVHGWENLSPFSNIAKMVDLMILFIKILLMSIVLISVMNVMMMAVYERIREIGMISAIGTPPRRILLLFLSEGLLLGFIGIALGVGLSLGAIAILNIRKIPFTFGQGQNLLLTPEIAYVDVLTIAAMVAGIAVLASLQPAWKAARMDPIAALRHV